MHTWKALLDGGGIDALRNRAQARVASAVDQGQLAGVRAALLQSPTEHGFATER
jgi:hypothetical protein